MSATIASQEFSSYFAMPMKDMMKPAPVITIEGQAHEVKVHFLEDIQDCWGTVSSFLSAAYFPSQI